jgi:hypothetical protein
MQTLRITCGNIEVLESRECFVEDDGRGGQI